jgi:hypothetical protein
MFDRASKKLGLEQAVLGSRQFCETMDSEDALMKNSAKMDAKEMETLLRQGAYAVFNDEADADNIVKEFCEQDIDSILDQRAHVRVVEGGQGGQTTETWLNTKKGFTRAKKSMFTGDSAMQHAEIDVNDPDFWKKVLPDLVTPDMMLDRLRDLLPSTKERGAGNNAGNEEEDEEADSEDEDERDDGMDPEVMDKFMADMTQMMDGILDLQRRGQLPDRERSLCMKLLLRMTLRPDVFEMNQLNTAQDWLTVLEGTRNRRAKSLGPAASVERPTKASAAATSAASSGSARSDSRKGRQTAKALREGQYEEGGIRYHASGRRVRSDKGKRKSALDDSSSTPSVNTGNLRKRIAQSRATDSDDDDDDEAEEDRYAEIYSSSTVKKKGGARGGTPGPSAPTPASKAKAVTSKRGRGRPKSLSVDSEDEVDAMGDEEAYAAPAVKNKRKAR